MTERTDGGPARAPEFLRNPELERLLALLERPLHAAETSLREQISSDRRPIVLILGCARSGSTLLLQLLAESGAFAFPSNFISRFYAAPILGGLLQKMLFDPNCQFHGELSLRADDSTSYSSALGKTEGALSPNEFHYFWRRWFEEVDGYPPTLGQVDGTVFGEIREELQGLAGVFERPLALKAHLLNWILPLVSKQVPDAFLVFLRRDPLFAAQSLLEARVRFFGSKKLWYSFKPPEVGSLALLPPEGQVAAQVVFTERAIEAGLREVDPSRVVEISYEELSSSPESVWRKLADTLASHPGCPDLGDCPRTMPFRSGNVRRLPASTLEAIRTAVEGFGG